MIQRWHSRCSVASAKPTGEKLAVLRLARVSSLNFLVEMNKMKVEKVEYVHIEMHVSEANKLITVLEQIHRHDDTLDTMKAEAIEMVRKLDLAVNK